MMVEEMKAVKRNGGENDADGENDGRTLFVFSLPKIVPRGLPLLVDNLEVKFDFFS